MTKMAKRVYKTVSGATVRDFDLQLNTAINDGWSKVEPTFFTPQGAGFHTTLSADVDSILPAIHNAPTVEDKARAEFKTREAVLKALFGFDAERVRIRCLDSTTLCTVTILGGHTVFEHNGDRYQLVKVKDSSFAADIAVVRDDGRIGTIECRAYQV